MIDSTNYFLTNLNYEPRTGNLLGIVNGPLPTSSMGLARVDTKSGSCSVTLIPGLVGLAGLSFYDIETGLVCFIL